MIVFAKTRHHYDSYTDFWELVRLSGFDTCYVDEIDRRLPNFYIFSPWNGEADPHLKTLGEGPGRIAWWCLERFDAMSVPYIQALDQADPLVDEMWVSDRWIASLDPRLRHITMGSHPGLGNTPLAPEYDFTHQSYAWGRRAIMYKSLKKKGLTEGPSAWGPQRDAVLRRSRLMLNLQQYPDPVTAPLRFALAAAYHLPVVSETIRDPYPLADLITCASYYDIPTAVESTLGASGESLHVRLCQELTFKNVIEASV